MCVLFIASKDEWEELLAGVMLTVGEACDALFAICAQSVGLRTVQRLYRAVWSGGDECVEVCAVLSWYWFVCERVISLLRTYTDASAALTLCAQPQRAL